MSDKILIKDLLLRAIIGVNPEERRDRQDLLVNIVLQADCRAAGSSDLIEDAVNYRTIAKRVIALVENSGFYLVEKMAAEIAALCLEEPRVRHATVRVEKPGALRFARSVGVEIERSRDDASRTNRAFVSMGSNVEPERHLPESVRLLAGRCQLLAVSRAYETAPVGTTGGPRFINGAVLVAAALGPEELKEQVLLPLETALGRVRTADKNAPRTIDLDISLYNDQILWFGGRRIPDPDILRYAHVAQPLADLAPHYRHPETGHTLLDIARRLPAEGLEHRPDLVLWPASQAWPAART
jgi:dihydroneopterin aldolase / 2-amino-4-hydroxy-6-hydroxymethyldihydropteridine diphosphokinase